MVVAASVGLAFGVGQMVRHRLRRERIPGLLVIGVVLTATLGGLATATGDPRILLVKPSIIYAGIGTVMLPRGWVRRYVPAIGHELLGARTLDRVGWGWSSLMFGTALLNLVLLATLPPRSVASAFVIWATVSKCALFAGQYAVLKARATRAYLSRARDATASGAIDGLAFSVESRSDPA